MKGIGVWCLVRGSYLNPRPSGVADIESVPPIGGEHMTLNDDATTAENYLNDQ